MNELIKKQLQSLKNINIEPFDDNSTKIFIHKKDTNITNMPSSDIIELKIAREYIIKLADYIIDPPPNFTLHANWNKNIVPKYQFMRCLIIQDLGKMIKIKGISLDNDTLCENGNTWEGWLPKKSITVLQCI